MLGPISRLFVALQYVAPKRAVSGFTGMLATVRAGWLSRLAIRIFIRIYGVDMAEAAEPDARSYASFNAFFIRELAPGARPLAADAAVIVSPADGTVSAIGRVDGNRIIQAKGIDYTAHDLFDGDPDLARRFENGRFLTIYLAPRNYHRVHLPLAGQARFLRYVPGALFSVDDTTTRIVRGLFCRNERAAAVYDTRGGSFALVMVGALNVGSIELELPSTDRFSNRPHANYAPGETHALDLPPSAVGAEFGRFNLGSTVILVTSPGLVEWSPALAAGSSVKMGEAIGNVAAQA